MTGVEAARLYAIVGANLTGLEKGMAEAEGIVSSSARKMDSKLSTFAEGTSRLWKKVALGAAAVAVASGALGLNFQKQMALIQSSAGGSARDVQVLSKQVLNLAKGVPQGPGELAKALYHLKSLGMDNAQAMNVLKQSVRGAIAGQADLEDVTNALGGAVRTQIKGTGDYSKAMATLNAITGAGNMRMGDLTAALGTGILPAAKAAGLSLRDVGAALATMTDENVPANMAATRLRMSFALLAAPSQKANETLQKIGLSGDKLAHAMQGPNGLVNTIALLKQHLDAVQDPAKRFQILSQSFGGGRSATAIELLVNNLEVLRKKYEQIDKSAGQFDQDVIAQQKTALNQLKTAWSSVEVALIKLSASILPPFVALAKGIASVADAFSNLSPRTQKFIVVALGASVAALGVMTALGKVVLAIRGVIAGTNALGVAFAFLAANPVVAIIGGIVALTTAFIVAYKTSATFRDKVHTVLMDVLNFFKTFDQEMVNGFEYAWTEIERGAVKAALGVVEPFSHLPGVMGGWARKAKAKFEAELDTLKPPNMDWSAAAEQAGALAGNSYAQAFNASASKATVIQVGKKAPTGYEPGTYGSQMSTRTNPGGFTPAFSYAPGSLQKMVADVAKQYGIPVGLAMAQIKQESGFNPLAHSSAGAEGIAQFMPGTAREYGVSDPYNAAQALQGYGKMMSSLIKKFGVAGALSAYNSGNPRAYLNPSFASGQTYNYVRSIMAAAGLSAPSSGLSALTGVHYNPNIYSGNGGTKKPSVTAGDNLLSQTLRNAIAKAQNKANEAQGKIAAHWLNIELADLEKARTQVDGKLKGSTGKQRAAIEQEIRSIGSRISTVNKAITENLKAQATAVKQAFTSKLSSEKSAITSAVSTLKSTLDAQFEQMTNDYINNVLAPRYFQGTDEHGVQRQTEAEKALAKMQAEDTANGLADALTQAQNQLAADIKGAADQATIAQDKTAIAQAQRAITENDLSIKATAERAQADHDYAVAVQKYQADRQVLEAQLNTQLDTWGKKLATGASKLGDLNGIAATFGLTLTGITDPKTGIGSDFANLSTAVNDLSATMFKEAKRLTALGDKKDAKKIAADAKKVAASAHSGPLVHIDQVNMNSSLDVEAAASRIGRAVTTRMVAA